MKKKEIIESLTPAERMGRLLVTVIKYFSLLLATFLALLPLVSCLLVSFKTDEEYQLTPVMQLRKNFLNFENLSVSLDESAILDGCTYFGVFFKILFPLLRPAIVTVMILKGIGVYNEYYAANLYLQDKTRFVAVSMALYTFTGPFGNAYNLICAGVILTLIPMLIIFIACQRQIYSGLAAGSIKG